MHTSVAVGTVASNDTLAPSSGVARGKVHTTDSYLGIRTISCHLKDKNTFIKQWHSLFCTGYSFFACTKMDSTDLFFKFQNKTKSTLVWFVETESTLTMHTDTPLPLSFCCHFTFIISPIDSDISCKHK